MYPRFGTFLFMTFKHLAKLRLGLSRFQAYKFKQDFLDAMDPQWLRQIGVSFS